MKEFFEASGLHKHFDYLWSQNELIKSTLIVIFWFRRTSAISNSWYLEEQYTTGRKTSQMVTNILKELAKTINMK